MCDELKRQSAQGKVEARLTTFFFFRVPTSKNRVGITSRRRTSALGCLKVSKNSSSIAESTAMFAAGGGRGRTSGAALQPRRQRLRRGRNDGTSRDQGAGAGSLDLSLRVALPEVAGPAFSRAAESALPEPRDVGGTGGRGEDYGVSSGPNRVVLPRFRATTTSGWPSAERV